MTYSRMAFCGRPPAVPEAASKKIRGQRVLGVRAQPQRTSSSSIAPLRRSFERSQSHLSSTMKWRWMVPDAKKPPAGGWQPGLPAALR